jgi:ring-1,2-phenylacetyl-CoA epoxidase subunit PaaC
MDQHIRNALSAQLLAWGDDELILGHRDSEWCGHAPILEEDIAFANIALDELGHAQTWYFLLAQLLEEDANLYPDHLVYRRPAAEFRNVQLVEFPNGDWAFSMLRQYLFDAMETIRLERLRNSRDQALAGAALKLGKEETYHRRHTQAWVQRLSGGSQESHRRTQAALETLWPAALQLFNPLAEETQLVESALIPPSRVLEAAWVEETGTFLKSCGLAIPASRLDELNRQVHSASFNPLIAELQSVNHLDLEAEW